MIGAADGAAGRPPTPPPRIAVVGGADASEEERRVARELGSALARVGAVVVCGGHGGVMEAAARGAAEAGGLTVGILRGEDAGEANAWVVLPIPTGMGDARNALVVRAAEAVVSVGGAWGTLSEIALARKAGLAVGTLGTPPAGDLGLPALETPAAAADWALARVRERRGEKPSAGSGQSRRHS
ncbi:MAG: TIGR00725 family protein [Gemmatimonadetes bacterium]|nr:TIGR00725 family protein [Gemmatimonadota bacterium]